jgi:hypothetical protein
MVKKSKGDAMRKTLTFAAFSTAAALAAFAPPASAQTIAASAQILARYDTNHDGVVTREEMDTGCKADFEAADTNHDGKLTSAEITAENALRLRRDGGQAAPVRDWNGDGSVDLAEFCNAAHAYFTTIDTKNTGQVKISEMRDASLIPQEKVDALQSPIADPNYNPANTLPAGGTGSYGQ